MREIIEEDGVRRFKANRIVDWCLDNQTDLNQISVMVDKKIFTREELKEFYQLLGYSVDGYEEIFEEENIK